MIVETRAMRGIRLSGRLVVGGNSVRTKKKETQASPLQTDVLRKEDEGMSKCKALHN